MMGNLGISAYLGSKMHAFTDAVFFNGWMLHKAGSFNKLYTHDYRYTIAYKLTIPGDEDYAKNHGEKLLQSYGQYGDTNGIH